MHLLLVFSLIYLLDNSCPAVARYQRRDAPSLQPLNIPVKLDQNRYSVGVVMGSNQQSFDFALSTSTGYSAVAGTGCNSCNDVPSYNASASSTSQNLSGSQGVSFVQSNASGNLIRENCGLTQSNGSAWAYPNQTLIMANQSTDLFTPGISGVIGLGNNARGGDFSSTVYSGWLSRHPSRSNFTFGMALNTPNQGSSSDGGVLHWLAPDPSFYQGDVSWKTLSPFNSSSSVQSDWFIDMDGFWFMSANGPNISETGSLLTVVDPYYSTMTFPQSISRAIYGNVNGASLLPANSSTNIWTVPCNTQMRLALTFGSLSVTLDESTLVAQSGNLCFGTIEQWADPDVAEYVLGSSVVSALYIIFSMSSSNGTIGFAQRKSSSSGLSGGAIAGIVLGALAFVIASITLGILLYRICARRRKRSTQQNGDRPETPPAVVQAPMSPMSGRSDENAILLPWGVSSLPSSPGSPSWTLTYNDTASNHEGQVITISPSYTHPDGSDVETLPPYVAGSHNDSRPVSVPLSPPRDRKRRSQLA